MTWATQLARLNASLVDETRGLGESCILYLQGIADGVPLSAVLSKVPQGINDIGAWEEVPTAYVRAIDCPSDPQAGDLLIEDAGPRWIVDRADREDGMWRLTLRADPTA